MTARARLDAADWARALAGPEGGRPDDGRDAARRVKAKAGRMVEQLGGQAAIGLTRVGSTYAVKVSLQQSPPGTSADLPREIDGVKLVYDVIGPVRAR